MQMKTPIIAYLLMTLVGCSTDLYVRDMNSNPVKNADIDVTRFSLSGYNVGKTDFEGKIKVPWGLPAIEYITATKNELTGTLSYKQLKIKPYIVVVRPITEKQMPVLNFDTGYSAPDFINETAAARKSAFPDFSFSRLRIPCVCFNRFFTRMRAF